MDEPLPICGWLEVRILLSSSDLNLPDLNHYYQPSSIMFTQNDERTRQVNEHTFFQALYNSECTG